MKKIPYNVQLLLSASNQINDHNRAVEELVYNALDAGATSIAIRINIQENTIQVIDNGCGVSSKDYICIGHKYMTSKYIDLFTLKSAPSKYGFRGQALANIINVSKSVKVISRHENSKETWMKLFEYGTEKLISKCSTRPSKGTTIEITGFLYNLSIQKKSKNILSNLHIKTFLEQLSLIHCDISLSLRDDSKNEIIFRMHKNRDIYQTLSTLYNINNNNLQELQVEKNEYKVTAYFGKTGDTGKQFIYLNGKFLLNTSKLHKVVNNNLSKHYNVKCILKSKLKNMNTEKSNWIQKKVPDYFIFIKCPYKDYDMSNSPKQSVLEFKDWDQINKLLDKLVMFLHGDTNLNRGKEVDKNQASNNAEYGDTREQVKKIMVKILGSHSKKPGISHMQNAVKGKQAKRKYKKLSLKTTVGRKNCKDNGNDNSKSENNKDDVTKPNGSNDTKKSYARRYSKSDNIQSCFGTNIGKKYNVQFKKAKSNILENKNKDNRISKKKRYVANKDVILRKFQMKTNSVRKICDKLERRTKNIMDQMYKNACINMCFNENIDIKNTIPKRHINISVRKQIDEIIINNEAFKRPNSKLTQKDYVNVKQKLVQSNYDLLQTILKTQQENSVRKRNVADKLDETAAIMSPPKLANIKHADKSINMAPENNFTEPIVTFESHNCNTYQRCNTEIKSYHSLMQIQNANKYQANNRPRTFISKESRDNFVIPNEGPKSNYIKKKNLRPGLSKQFQSHIKNLFRRTSNIFNLKKQIMGTTDKSSYSIEFTENNNNNVIITDTSRNKPMIIGKRCPEENLSKTAQINHHISIDTGTYVVSTVGNNGYTIHDDETFEKSNNVIDNTDSPNQDYINKDNSQNNKHFIFISKSQEHDQNKQVLNPIDVCEAILQSKEMLDREFELTFNENQNNLFNNQNCSIKFQGNGDRLRGLFYSKENEAPKYQNVLTHCNMNHDLHFSPDKNVTNKVNRVTEMPPILTSRPNIEKQLIQNKNIPKKVIESNLDGFKFMTRLCFLPKGMSPILQNCETKSFCEYYISKDYYEKDMYINFAVDVRNNAEIFEPKIKDAKVTTTTTIDKVSTKLTDDNSALIFDGQSLKNAKILGQIDEKFVAAIMKEGSNIATTDYLILFDQHAVHERIRLENNLTDYFNDNQWKPAKIDTVSFILSKDDVLYLHNFKSKFEQLGLQWTVTNTNFVSFSAIPEAILGKNSRQVEKVIQAVKNLITEEINSLKIQRGCVSLYPKSIMDLVCNEACRYAIKFGDKLSKGECAELVKKLSECKTPFQCAHGRPVMAVIMETKRNKVDYKVHFDKIVEWKRKL